MNSELGESENKMALSSAGNVVDDRQIEQEATSIVSCETDVELKIELNAPEERNIEETSTCTVSSENKVDLDVQFNEFEGRIDEVPTCTSNSGCNVNVMNAPNALQDGRIEEATTSAGGSAKSPSITITFHNEHIMELYKDKFLSFINKFIELGVTRDELTLNVEIDHSIDTAEWSVVEEAPVSSVDETPSPNKKRKKRSKAKRELFTLDTNPSEAEVDVDLRYTSKFKLTPDIDSSGPKQPICFNCDKFHQLRDCPEPKNFEKIQSAKQKFKISNTRYHLDDEQKYGHFAPGKLTKKLRYALGLRMNELPPYIYLMRRLGYPPGWLEEAKIVHSELEMFDFDGKHVKRGKSKKKGGLNGEKIVEFPGFNAPLEEGVEDKHWSFCVPPYSDNFSKEAMINHYNNITLTENQTNSDMEIDENGKEEQVDQGKIEANLNEAETADLLTLNDLEQEKQKLLEELNETKPVAKVVKTSSFGTPILKSSSSYMKLPNPDNFSKDVSPIINFENLPNSTGKYEKMNDVLQKVRETLKRNQSIDST